MTADALDGPYGRRARRLDPLGVERQQKLAQEQRVAARHLVARLGQRRRCLATEAVPYQPRDGRLAERSGAQHGYRRIGGELPEQPLVLTRLGVAGGHDEQDRQLLDSPRDVSDEGRGAGVGPMQVVDDGQQWATVRDMHEEPEQTVQELEPGLAGFGRRELWIEDRAGMDCGLGEQLLSFLLGGRTGQALKQLAHDAEGETLLELRPACPQHARAGLAAQRCRHRAHSRLSDPGEPITAIT